MSRPLVVVVLEPDDLGEDRGYHTYTQAYGVEMQIDDEVDATTVLLASLDGLHVFDGATVVEEDPEEEDFDDDDDADLDDEIDESDDGGMYAATIPLVEMGDVHAGAYGVDPSLRLSELPSLAGDRLGWLMLPHGAPPARLMEAVEVGLRPVLHIVVDSPDTDLGQLADDLSQLPDAVLTKTVLAIEPQWTFAEGEQMDAVDSAAFCGKVAELIKSRGAVVPTLLYGGAIDATVAAAWVSQPGIDGLFFNHERQNEQVFGPAIEALESIG